jgi:uncharacterized cupin superfamily protein
MGSYQRARAGSSSTRAMPGRAALCAFEGDARFPQIGINIRVFEPGEPMTMYHWESNQEDFLVLAGEPLLIAEGEERPLRQWDFVHCPAGTPHTIVGAGTTPCVVLAAGARDHPADGRWGGYTVDETARRHGAGVETETADANEAYAPFPKRAPTRYREGWLRD